MNTSNKQFWHAQAHYNYHFVARLRHTKDVVSPGDIVFVNATLFNQPHKLAPVASSLFHVVAVDMNTVTTQRFDGSVEKRFSSAVRKNVAS